MQSFNYNAIKNMLLKQYKLDYFNISISTGISPEKVYNLLDEDGRHNFEEDLNLFYRVSVGLNIPLVDFIGERLMNQICLKEEGGFLVLTVRPLMSPQSPIFIFD